LLNDPASGTLSTPIVTVAAQEQELYDNSSAIGAYADIFGAGVGNYWFRSNGSEIVLGEDGGFKTGTDYANIAGISSNSLSDADAWDEYALATSLTIMHWPQPTPAFGETGELRKAYYTPFTLDISYGVYRDASGTLRGVSSGTGASAMAVLNPADGEVSEIEMVSGGSGYTGTITFNRDPITTPFTVFGGPDGYKFNGGAIFETYSGIQYVRDIHYGVGRRIH
jgi:hypothetical protein